MFGVSATVSVTVRVSVSVSGRVSVRVSVSVRVTYHAFSPHVSPEQPLHVGGCSSFRLGSV